MVKHNFPKNLFKRFNFCTRFVLPTNVLHLTQIHKITELQYRKSTEETTCHRLSESFSRCKKVKIVLKISKSFYDTILL